MSEKTLLWLHAFKNFVILFPNERLSAARPSGDSSCPAYYGGGGGIH